jgi:hypothetical protein
VLGGVEVTGAAAVVAAACCQEPRRPYRSSSGRGWSGSAFGAGLTGEVLVTGDATHEVPGGAGGGGAGFGGVRIAAGVAGIDAGGVADHVSLRPPVPAQRPTKESGEVHFWTRSAPHWHR